MDLPMPTELRHIYRALLRAATYLPDSAARSYVHDRVVQRFRSTSNKIKYEKSLFTRDVMIKRYHGREHIQKTQRQARKLERAGLGSHIDLRKVLVSTYGRIGSRRRQLIRELFLDEEDASSDTESLENLIAARSKAESEKSEQYPPHSKVGSFLRSQRAKTPKTSFLTDRVIKRLTPVIPEENIWGRPLPMRRQASMKRDHWKTVLESILPPVPAHEWNRLRDLATGALPIENTPVRRSRQVVVERLEGDRNTTRLLDYFTTPVDQHRIGGRDTDEITIGNKGVTYWSKPRATAVVPEKDLHTRSTRYMRRLYAGIWQVTPMLSQDEVTKKWSTEWGAGITPFLSGELTTPKTRDLELFEGAEKVEALDKKNKRAKRARMKVKEADGRKIPKLLKP